MTRHQSHLLKKGLKMTEQEGRAMYLENLQLGISRAEVKIEKYAEKQVEAEKKLLQLRMLLEHTVAKA